MRLIKIMLFCLFCFGCAPANVKKQMHALSACQGNWQYFTVTKPITGKVISYHGGWCRGNSKMASSTVIITSVGDTVRVLELCNNTKFNPNEFVMVTWAQTPARKRAALDPDYDCKVQRTCYGDVTLKK